MIKYAIVFLVSAACTYFGFDAYFKHKEKRAEESIN